eukprot:23525-Chlamydomonas_euryale.AAC.2
MQHVCHICRDSSAANARCPGVKYTGCRCSEGVRSRVAGRDGAGARAEMRAWRLRDTCAYLDGGCVLTMHGGCVLTMHGGCVLTMHGGCVTPVLTMPARSALGRLPPPTSQCSWASAGTG